MKLAADYCHAEAAALVTLLTELSDSQRVSVVSLGLTRSHWVLAGPGGLARSHWVSRGLTGSQLDLMFCWFSCPPLSHQSISYEETDPAGLNRRSPPVTEGQCVNSLLHTVCSCPHTHIRTTRKHTLCYHVCLVKL